MLFEKLIEQHSVHRFVTDRTELPMSIIANHEIGIHLLHLFSY